MEKQIKDLKRRALHNADAAYYVLCRARDNTYSRRWPVWRGPRVWERGHPVCFFEKGGQDAHAS
jgi:hypothetical protein